MCVSVLCCVDVVDSEGDYCKQDLVMIYCYCILAGVLPEQSSSSW